MLIARHAQTLLFSLDPQRATTVALKDDSALPPLAGVLLVQVLLLKALVVKALVVKALLELGTSRRRDRSPGSQAPRVTRGVAAAGVYIESIQTPVREFTCC